MCDCTGDAVTNSLIDRIDPPSRACLEGAILNLRRMSSPDDFASRLIVRMQDLVEHVRDMPDSLPYEVEIGKKNAPCAGPLRIEKNQEFHFLAFPQEQLGDLKRCDAADTMPAKQVWSPGLYGA